MTKQDSRAIQRCIGNLEEIQKKIREQIVAVDGVCSGARMKTFSENDLSGIGREIEQAEEGAIRLNAALASLREGIIFLQESIGAMIVPPHSIMIINEAQQCVRASNKLPAFEVESGYFHTQKQRKKERRAPHRKGVHA